MKIKDWEKVRHYGIVNDHGEDWEFGRIIERKDTLGEAQEWAENENYHSASIVEIDNLGKRIRKVA